MAGASSTPPATRCWPNSPASSTALKCAVEAQRDLAERNKELPENRKLQFRIGVNLGDIVVDGDEIYGDGINVAARLEALADAGGICISRPCSDHVKGKVELGFEYLGAKKVKNIDEPVNTYKRPSRPRDGRARSSAVKKTASRAPLAMARGGGRSCW